MCAIDVAETGPAGHRVQMKSIVVTGAAGPVAESVLATLTQQPGVASLHIVAPAPVELPDSALDVAVRVTVADLVGADLVALIGAAEAVVHLGATIDATDPRLLADGRIVDEARAVLAAAEAAGVGSLVVVSSAMVYGALPTNGVPLTEQAVLHPEATYRPGVELAEIEREIGDWRDRNDGVDVTVLRCAPVVADGTAGWLAAEMRRAFSYPVADRDPETQFLHASDLGTAIATALSSGAPRVANVAPDGWLTDAQRRDLETRPRIHLPPVVAARMISVRASVSGSALMAGIVPYVTYPWVVANGSMRDTGWSPQVSNDEAYVAAFRAAPWSMVSSSRRQQLALGSVGATGVVAAAAIVALVRRRYQNRR